MDAVVACPSPTPLIFRTCPLLTRFNRAKKCSCNSRRVFAYIGTYGRLFTFVYSTGNRKICSNIIIAKFRNFVLYSTQMKQHEYSIEPITVNGIQISRVVIDEHYKHKHSDHINDHLILKLVAKLDGRKEAPDDIVGKYSYFATLVELNEKQYRLVWLLEEDAIYIGVVNAYRDKRRS